MRELYIEMVRRILELIKGNGSEFSVEGLKESLARRHLTSHDTDTN